MFHRLTASEIILQLMHSGYERPPSHWPNDKQYRFKAQRTGDWCLWKRQEMTTEIPIRVSLGANPIGSILHAQMQDLQVIYVP